MYADDTCLYFSFDSEDHKPVGDEKYLGAQINQEIKWTNHLSTVMKKISMVIGILHYAKQYIPPVTIETMYTLFFHENKFYKNNEAQKR